MNTNTEASVLAHHGIVGGGHNLTDEARAAGVIFACLGCGSVGGIDIANLANHADAETARRATRDAVLEMDEDGFDCCPDSTTILY